MVGVAIPRVNDIGGDGFDVVGDEEAVDRHAEGRLLVVGFVGRAAGGDGVFGVKRHDKGEPVGDRPLGDGLRPGVVLAARDAEDLGRIAKQVLVEVAARDAVVAVFIFRQHVGAEHFKLLGRDGAVGRVGRKMQVIEHQLPAVFHRDAADGVAAIEVNKLHNARLDRQRAAHGGRDRMARERHDTGLVCAVGVNKRIEEVGTVIILREDLVEFAVFHHITEISVLCDVPATRAVDVDLLKEGEVGRKVFDERDLAAHILSNGLPAAGAALLAAVHEEAVIVAVRAEAHVGRRNAVGDAGLRRALHRCGRGGVAVHHAERLPVLHAVVRGKDIDDVSQHDQNKRQQNIERNFQRFFHRKTPFGEKCQ